MARFLYFVVFVLNIFYVLVPQWKGSPIWNTYQDIETFTAGYIWLRQLSISLLLILPLFAVSGNKKLRSKDILPFAVLALTYALSLLFNGKISSIFTAISISLNYFAIYLTLQKNYYDLSSFIIIILSIWVLLPVIDFFFLSDSYRQSLFFYSSSEIGGFNDNDFSGYAYHKNAYGYICGLLIIILQYQNINKALKLIMIPIIILCILFSGCRSVLVAILGVFIISYFNNKRNKLHFIKSYANRVGTSKLRLKYIGLILFIVAISVLAILFLIKNSVFDDPFRLLIYEHFVDVIQSNLFWGVGEPVFYDSDDPAHNFILQILADNGLFCFVAFIWVILHLFKASTRIGQMLIIYLMIISLFQPTLSLSAPSSLITVFLLIPCFLNEKSELSNRITKV